MGEIQQADSTEGWAAKINENRSTYTLLAGVVVFVIFIAFWYTNNLKQQSEKAWQLVGSVSSAMGNSQVSDSTLRVVDLNVDARTLVKQKLMDIESIPEYFRDSATNLDDVYVRKLPEDLRRTALMEHYRAAIEDELSGNKKTSATPHLYYWLANINFMQENFTESRKWYQKLIDKYPNHFLRADAERDLYLAEQQETWQKNNLSAATETLDNFAQNSKEQVQVITSKGKFSVDLFSKNNDTINHFLSLVNSGFYNGLVFYNSSPEKIYTGCKQGNGQSNSGKTDVEFQDVYVQRGLVVLEHEKNEFGKVDSRLYIVKKYPYFNGLQRCTIVGIISEEGMKVVDSLENVDVVLDVSLKQVTQ